MGGVNMIPMSPQFQNPYRTMSREESVPRVPSFPLTQIHVVQIPEPNQNSRDDGRDSSQNSRRSISPNLTRIIHSAVKRAMKNNDLLRGQEDPALSAQSRPVLPVAAGAPVAPAAAVAPPAVAPPAVAAPPLVAQPVAPQAAAPPVFAPQVITPPLVATPVDAKA